MYGDHRGGRGSRAGDRGRPAERGHDGLGHLPDETLLAAEETCFVTKAAQRPQVHPPDGLGGKRLRWQRMAVGLGQDRRLAPERGHVLGVKVDLGAEETRAGSGLRTLSVRLPPEVRVQVLARGSAQPGSLASVAAFILENENDIELK